ncbi:MAG: NUDIX hydrolase [Verrucomicrobia bacterium]|nr:NUDIX hydrolase [Verrucomicrobiota bacterium]
MRAEPTWLTWAREVQAIAQIGLHFTESPYDRERYERLRELAIEVFARYSDLPEPAVRATFEQQQGYATPKVDVRGVVFRGDKILLVQERSDGLWTLPGGWADVNDSPSEAVEREILEESGFTAKPKRLLALYDRGKHPHQPPFAFHVYKIFIECELLGGSARTSYETTAVDFFAETELPPLSESRVLAAQIKRCFALRLDPQAPPYFD